ncbi:MAG: hypothetical protein JSW00_09420 [Thermoplasmata archaeon]|nr:MAG: hypothetical protein JSW00_09420 [Thermoplasmata archaeon]
MYKIAIVRISVIMLLICVINPVTVSQAPDGQSSEQIDLLNQSTMKSINNTIIRESVNLVIQYDFDTDMDGIPDANELGFEFDFDNDIGLADDPNNPVTPDTGPDNIDRDSDNDGILDWPWGNDTILIQPITGKTKSLMELTDVFSVYVDEVGESTKLQFSPEDNNYQLDISKLRNGEHVIYVQHIVNDGYNLNTSTFEFYIEVQKDSNDQDSFPIIWLGLIAIILICVVLLALMMLYRR